MQVSIDLEFQSLIPALSAEERAGLEADIVRDGRATVPLVVWGNVLLDGHNRFDICTKHGLPFTTTPIEGIKDRLDARIWIGRTQLNRRNLDALTRVQVADQVAGDECKRKGAANRSATLKQNAGKMYVCPVCHEEFDREVWHCKKCDHHWLPGDSPCRNCQSLGQRSAEAHNPKAKPVSANLPKRTPIDTRAEVAKIASVGERTVDHARAVLKGTPELQAAVRRGDVAISTGAALASLAPAKQREVVASGPKAQIQAAKEIKAQCAEVRLKKKLEVIRQIEQAPTFIPSGKYRVIVIDPPWQYDTKAENSGADLRGVVQYADMSVQQICAVPVASLAETDCLLWCWTTNAFMHEAYHCLEAWGFTPKTILTWDKQHMGLGKTLRNVTEHCIVAIRGKPVLTLTNQTTLLSVARREHSRKPDEFYALVDSLCHGSKLDMFARESRKGWTLWGAETSKFNARAGT